MTHSWLNPACEVRRTQCGNGVFAREHLLSGTRVAIFGGHVMPILDEPVFPGGGDYAMQIAEDFVLGTKHEADIEDVDLFNHSCAPNVGFKGQIFLVAMRDIPPDEEVRFDYAMCLSPVEGMQYEFQCRCGTPGCRGKVTNRDWLIAELQARYDGFFQWYLQEKIDRLKTGRSSKPVDLPAPATDNSGV